MADALTFDDLIPGNVPSAAAPQGGSAGLSFDDLVPPAPAKTPRGPLAQMIVNESGGRDPSEEPNVYADVAKSGGIGVVKGGIGLAGATGDVRDLAIKLGEHLGLDPERAQAVLNGLPGILGLVGKAPTSADLRGRLEDVTGPLYEPKTTAGKVAQTAGEFLPALIGGPEALAVKLGTRVLAPAAAATAAGEYTGDNPYAKAGAAVAAGVLAHKVTTPRVPTVPRPTAEQVRDASHAGYNAPEVAAVQIQPASVERFANGVVADLNVRGQLDNVAPQTHNALDRLRNTGNVPGLPQGVATVAEIDSVRKNLVELAKDVLPNGRPTSEATAAMHARRQIDRYLSNLQQPDLIAGNAQQASQTLRGARADWASAAQAEDIGARLTRAERQAARSGSGSNIDNAIRQKVSAVLDVPERAIGLRPDEIAQAERVVRGTPLANVLRKAGKLGFNDGLSLLLHAGAVGPTGGANIPVGILGTMARKGAEAITQRNASRLESMILDRSAEAGRWRAANAQLPAPPRSSVTSQLARILALANTDERLGPPAPYLGLRPPLGIPGQQPVP